MEFIKNLIKSAFLYIKVLAKWLVAAVVVGTVGGVIGSIFHKSIDYATELRTEHSWLIFLLPLGGVLITVMYHLFKKSGKIDTNRVIESVMAEEKVPLVMAPLIFVATVITHLLGGSAGREGAALQLGGSIGYNLGKAVKMKKDDIHIIVMSGMSAVFAALFGTPLTAAVFALEVVSVGTMHYTAFVPCIISSIFAYKIAMLFDISPVHFNTVVFESLSANVMLKAIILAILCAIVAILFCTAIKKCEHYAKKFMPNRYLRAFLGGAIIVALTVVLGTKDYNGAGMDVISRALSGTARYEAFAIKIIFTAITISVGFKGGEIVPAFFIGSTFGCVFGSLLGLEPSFGAALGFVALFCSVVNCPLASVMLALEVFGADSILIFATVCAVSFMMSGYSGLYKSQKIVYSKLSEEIIDINAK